MLNARFVVSAETGGDFGDSGEVEPVRLCVVVRKSAESNC